ncbi:MAG: hypothetical protein ACOCRX_08515 [Candidatus Woesearchaeota archaeon]
MVIKMIKHITEDSRKTLNTIITLLIISFEIKLKIMEDINSSRMDKVDKKNNQLILKKVPDLRRSLFRAGTILNTIE